MKAILIGYGEIGKGIYDVFSDYHDIEICEIDKKPRDDFDIMLVAIPYSENFIEIINNYRVRFNVKATIIFSTVPIGTTSQIPDAVHSPIEGKHPHLAESIEIMRRWVGGFNVVAHKFFRDAYFTPKYLPKPEYTEFLKLQSTAMYGLNIEFARYVNSVCKDLEMDYDIIKDFNRDYNILYQGLGMREYQRYILDPPKGNIGGHCIVPNAKILDKQYPSMFLKEIYRDKEAGE